MRLQNQRRPGGNPLVFGRMREQRKETMKKTIYIIEGKEYVIEVMSRTANDGSRIVIFKPNKRKSNLKGRKRK